MKPMILIVGVLLVISLCGNGEAKLVNVVPRDYIDCPDKSTALPASLLLAEPVVEPGKLFKRINKKIQFPKEGEVGTDEITCIIVKNQNNDDRSDYDLTVMGGVGEKSVTFTFKSQSGKGLALDVEVYK